MSQKTASRTALATAYMRAAHQLLDPPPRILEDPAAVAVLGPAPSSHPGICRRSQRRKVGSACTHGAAVAFRRGSPRRRSRGVTQYVILGAGFDTFAVRQPPWATMRILEVDHAGRRTEALALRAARGPSNAGLRPSTSSANRCATDCSARSFPGSGDHVPTRSTRLRSVAEFPQRDRVDVRVGERHPATRRGARASRQPWVSFFEPRRCRRSCSSRLHDVELLTPAAAQAATSRRLLLPTPQRTTIVAAVR